MGHTSIEWTDRTWNPVDGCDKVSAGCDHCYAEAIANRFAGTAAYPNGFTLTLRAERLEQPLGWRTPKRVFVNSMSDVFHDDVPEDYLAKIFAVMAAAPRHTFQILTKRHARMRTLLSSDAFRRTVQRRIPYAGSDPYAAKHHKVWPLPNVWLGVSVEDQKWADIRIPALLATPAAIRFISAEPLLGPLDLAGEHHNQPRKWLDPGGGGIDWVIAGGESGPQARPMHPGWVRALRDQCAAADVAFLFKQWGAFTPVGLWRPETGRPAGPGVLMEPFGSDFGYHMLRVGKKKAGRELDGHLHDNYPHTKELLR